MKAHAKSFTDIARSSRFQTLIASKKRFLLPMSIFFVAFYFALPLLTSYTKILNASAFGPISWAWVFAFGQFVMTWVLCMVYSRKAAQYDLMIEEIRSKNHLP